MNPLAQWITLILIFVIVAGYLVNKTLSFRNRNKSNSRPCERGYSSDCNPEKDNQNLLKNNPCADCKILDLCNKTLNTSKPRLTNNSPSDSEDKNC